MLLLKVQRDGYYKRNCCCYSINQQYCVCYYDDDFLALLLCKYRFDVSFGILIIGNYDVGQEQELAALVIAIELN